MSILDYIERIKRENEGPRITAQEPRTLVADASTEMEQSPDSFLRPKRYDILTGLDVPAETLEDFDVNFRNPNAQGGRTMAQEPRIGLQGGQLVQPGPGRPGYGGPGSGQAKKMTWLTQNQVAVMRKNLPDGISLAQDGHIKGQYNYMFSLEKGRGTKNYVTINGHLRATPENLEKLG